MALSDTITAINAALKTAEDGGAASSATQDVRICGALFHSPSGDKQHDPSLADALEELATGDYRDRTVAVPYVNETTRTEVAAEKSNLYVRTDRVAIFRQGGVAFVVARLTYTP